MESVILYSCPHCDQPVEADPDQSGEELLCPHCGRPFVLPEDPAATDEPPATPEPAEALNNLRIRQISLEKRAILRRRSFSLAGAGVCLLLAAQLLWNAVRGLRTEGPALQAIVFVLLAAGFATGAVLLIRRGRRLRRQLDEQTLRDDENLPPPDFSTLSDGSQRWKNLENIREE